MSTRLVMETVVSLRQFHTVVTNTPDCRSISNGVVSVQIDLCAVLQKEWMCQAWEV